MILEAMGGEGKWKGRRREEMKEGDEFQKKHNSLKRILMKFGIGCTIKLFSLTMKTVKPTSLVNALEL